VAKFTMPLHVFFIFWLGCFDFCISKASGDDSHYGYTVVSK